MKVSILGAKDRVLSSTLKEATGYFATSLVSTQLIPYLNIRILIKEKLDAGGYCQSEEIIKPRNFLIEIYKHRSKYWMLETLAHEMIHVKQMAKGQLKERSFKKQRVISWHGTVYQDDVSYWDQPWEIEAYELQSSLVFKYLMDYNKFKYFRQNPKNWIEKSIKE